MSDEDSKPICNDDDIDLINEKTHLNCNTIVDENLLDDNDDNSQIKSSIPKTEDISSSHSPNQSAVINRPPQPPGPAIGPCYQFITTDLDKMLWIGSALILRHISFDQPEIEFLSEAKVDYSWEVLYENLFSMRVYRINLFIELRLGEGDDKVIWKINWVDHSSEGSFYIARHDQKWRGGCFSCNGYDATIPKEVASGLNYDHVWNHLLSVHDETPLHILVWGGDQIYIDFVLEDVEFLRKWINMKWDERWTLEFDEETKIEIEEYYFNTYSEHWDCRKEMKRALSSIPGVMMWDDHDIFDGAGSYPPLIQNSPIMLGLFEKAQKMRLLFQHHTTFEKAREHKMFGSKGHNFLARCGPNLAILGADQRTERDATTVQDEQSWDMIFDKLENDVEGVKHLIVLFPVPFSYVRFRIAEAIFGFLKNYSMLWQNIPFLNKTNSVFGLPELYDDLLDEWTNEAHIEERNRVLQRFQQFAQKKKVRITFFSGDVHCCGVSRFRSRGENIPLPINDDKLMYQIISSAIVNKPPPNFLIQSLHFLAKKWYPIDKTEEEIIDFFDRKPESGKIWFCKKLLPNRNWCYFEQCSTSNSTVASTSYQTEFAHTFWIYMDYLLSVVRLNRMINWGKQGIKKAAPDQRDQALSSQQTTEYNQEADEANNLKLRFWLESTAKKDQGKVFAHYDLFVPYLK